MANFYHEAEAKFRRLLRTGKPIAFEDAICDVNTPEGFDRRALGAIPAQMHRAGEIVKAGFRQSDSAKHHCGIKQLWRLAVPSAAGEGGQ
ncbi:hypothetical protein Poly24_54800 [Rosistilla carotiformis]|uniref:Uncharacterized protein n=1 Tax=Rosistilla carotiformis TaxID=2528017 RepID=A0A518K1V1_9BACT|nr:hypothetical protein [Rosistilla carotiformis]QDV71740.1 hypothetical protein Poly24_54800 [Rosistilla carotiformis]